MSSEKDAEAFYKKLKGHLDETTEFPSLYLYKFIIPTNREKIEKVHEIFNNKGAVIETKKSSKGTYTSVSITVNMENSDAIIEKYKEVGEIEGVISL